MHFPSGNVATVNALGSMQNAMVARTVTMEATKRLRNALHFDVQWLIRNSGVRTVHACQKPANAMVFVIVLTTRTN